MSFFYTNKVIEFIRNTDPIMKNIKEYNRENKIDAINAKINKNKIIPGISGKEVDYDQSFKKMKQYGTYNESLTVFKEVMPTISIDDYYDKYISQGSGINHDVSLVFPVNLESNIDSIVNTLNENNVSATFFVDGLWAENNKDKILSMAEENHEIEILNYNKRYEQLYFSSSVNQVYQITNVKPKYCYAEYDHKEVLELCQTLNMHTIIPTIKTGNYPFNEIKQRIQEGSIISLEINSSTEIELDTIIKYLKQKGYEINILDILLNEASNVK